LREFSSKEEFAEAFRQEYSATYNHRLPAIRKKANELWTLAGLEEGGIVIANKGTSRILAAGEVLVPGYEFRPDLPEFRHTVRVNWDTSAAALSSPEQYAEAGRRLTAGARSRRVWWAVANPKEWAWDNLFEHGSGRWSRRRLQSHFQSVRPGGLIAGYQASPDQRVVAIAQLSRTPAPTDPDALGFEAVPLRRVARGPSWQELCESPVFKNSEPVRFNNQGTLFALAPAEAGELADLIAAQDPESAALLAADAPTPSSGPRSTPPIPMRTSSKDPAPSTPAMAAPASASRTVSSNVVAAPPPPARGRLSPRHR
jgi:hypothetical protein